ncbi:Kinesin-like protein bimC [Hypsizygus marmoreus]|uniref:Kinesin-like protein bimC n=1 Tax=Hypsizygus marmoreus TaxID=39966 RepID=A0A369JNY6_HYPMA|nr:Kinesin-like protein bimC [Hypsizygus marmoreus]
MATRRPASRARVNNNTNPMPPPALPRSRSVMSRSASTTRLNEESQQREPTVIAPTPKQKATSSSQDDCETNIQVVIRCRRRSEREVQDNSPSIVTSTGAKSKDVSIEVSAPISSMGLVTLPPTRTYPFDLVFGPEADQSMIYHEVVSPMLEEVLMGYNCTLFAYGQTGTGKTYTMQGDLNPTPLGNPSANAGMIPRVLFRLFHQLERSKSDYSVKVSFIELYNEELRDLLANDLSAPMGTTQPMGLAVKDSTKVVDNGLKIFDDTNKRGVMIQGLEEITVKDSQAALALLTKGSHRRQIAATKFNDHSSRSHSVFSITVHVKEPSLVGEDLLKVGKLNLVDLAGSENIGRSGAENKRAREAGMINQSLLTLGRVINALVDKASHIPYRESKLTRLLQDSLGGRTKTCIIATVSPARSNMEETLSTLDYAIRAKSIRNRPELNQRTTRNSLLKDYVAEIERLKADLVAAREKNGIFFSEETWTQMTIEQELRVTELEEARKQVEIVEGQMRGVREEFEQSIGLLKIRERELRDTREKLQETKETLGKREDELVLVKCALEEETVMRKAHQDTEVALDRVAAELKKVARHSVRDVAGLFDKLDRKTLVLNSNSQTVLTEGKKISTAGQVLSQKLDHLAKSSSQSMQKLRADAQDFRIKELDALSKTSTRIDKQLEQVRNALSVIQSQDASEADALGIAQKVLKDTHETFKMGFSAWGESLKATCESMSKEVEKSGIEAFGAVEVAVKNMVSLVETVVQEACDHVDAEREAVLHAKTLANDASNDEIARLREQNEALLKMLEHERIKGNKAKDELIQRVSGLLGVFVEERDKSLRDVVGFVQDGNQKSGAGMKAFVEEHDFVMKEMENNGLELTGTLRNRSGEGKRTRDGAFKTLGNAKTKFRGELDQMQNTISGSVTSYSTQVQKQTIAMTALCTDAFENHKRAKRARTEATTSMGAGVQSEYKHMQNTISKASRNIEIMTDKVAAEAMGHANSTEAYCAVASTQLGSLQTATDVLFTQGAQEDTPTAVTPRKRAWDYIDQWTLTQPREVVLRAWRQQGISSVGSETFLAEHLPLPEDDEGLEDDTETFELLKPVVEPENTPVDGVSDGVSLASSESSTSSIPVPQHRPVSKTGMGHKKAVPSLGTLTDARNVYTTRGSRRAR